MDYKEAIHCMKVIAEEEVCEECNYYYRCDHNRQADMARIAISAMQEMQALHDQGFSMERLKNIDFRKEVVEHINYDAYMSLMEELDEYREIGTLEEVREAAEKQNAKKPKGDLHSVPHYRCPNCNGAVKIYENSAKDKICRWCGQVIDWSEEE